MGGPVPIGYAVEDRKLVIVENEARTVRTIFSTYLELGSVRDLTDRLDELGVRTKLHSRKDGGTRGGVPFSRGGLHQLLRNRIYRGEIVHNGKAYPGEHEAIVDQELWDAVQQKLDENAVDRKLGRNVREVSLLAGLVVDEHRRPMSASHANKGTRRYRYYVTHQDHAREQARRVPAHDLEQIVIARVGEHLADLSRHLDGLQGAGLAHRIHAAEGSIDQLSSGNPQQVRAAVLRLIKRIEVGEERVIIRLAEGEAEEALVLEAQPAKIRSGREVKLVIPGSEEEAAARRDGKLVALLAKAHGVRERLIAGESVADIAAADGSSPSRIGRYARLGLLAPDIIAAAVEGKQPASMTRSSLWEATSIPLDWEGQRRLLGFA